MRLSSAGDPMIYRSRYLDRLLFSPLGYRQDARPKPAKRLQKRAETLREAETAQIAVASSAQAALHAGSSSVISGHLGERAPYLSSRELREVVGRCEQTIVSGQAQIEDYEAFVICQQELSSRA